MWSKRIPLLLALVALVPAGFSCSKNPPNTESLDVFWDGKVRWEDKWVCGDTELASTDSFALSTEIIVGEGVSPEEVSRALGAVSGIVRAYGGSLVLGSRVKRIAEQRLLEVDQNELSRAARGVDSPEKLQAIVAEKSLQGLRDFIGTHSRPRKDTLQIVFLTELVDSVGLGARILGDVVGFGVSSELVARTLGGETGGPWVAAAGLQGEFTPTLIVSVERLKGKSDREVGLILVHELGHALGLPHESEAPGSLMNPEPLSCVPPLEEHQRRAFKNAGKG